MPAGRGEPTTIPAALALAVHRFGDDEAVVDGAQRLSFSSLAERVHAIAGALLASGIEAGDRVAIWAPNSLEWIVAALGVQIAGGCIVPLNTRFKGAEAQHILQCSRARFLVMVERFLGNSYPQLLQ